MAKEIVEVTREKEETEELETRLFFHGGFNMPKRDIRGIYQADITTDKVKDAGKNYSYYRTTSKVIGIGKSINFIPVLADEYKEAILVHFKVVDKLKGLYLNQP